MGKKIRVRNWSWPLMGKKVQSLYGSYERQGFVKVSVSRAIGELSLYISVTMPLSKCHDISQTHVM